MAVITQMPGYPGWQTVKVIGNGSYGTVYEIQRDVYGDTERAALKVITLPHSDSELDYLRSSGLDDNKIAQTIHAQVGSIANEYKLMAQIRDCPNVVRCDDFLERKHPDTIGWDICIKMELLTPLLKRTDLISSEQQIVRLGKDLCQALIACQAHNIIHRDIKPQNIFISPRGEFKLGDFGIARNMDGTTNATVGMGTYSYMAPEVAKGQPYGRTADIYSLGLVLYWCLNNRLGPFLSPGRIPTNADNENAKNRRFSGEALPAPVNGSDALKQIVLKACAYHPRDRYQSAAELLTALKLLDQQPTYGVQAYPLNQAAQTPATENTYRVRPTGGAITPPSTPAVYTMKPEKTKKNRRSIVILVFSIFFLLTVLLCIPLLIHKLSEEHEQGNKPDNTTSAENDTSISREELYFDKSSIRFDAVGQQETLTVFMQPIDYTSTHGELIVEDPSVATAEMRDGVITVTAAGSGNTQVIMKCGDYIAICEIHCELQSGTSGTQPGSTSTQQGSTTPPANDSDPSADIIELTLSHYDVTLTAYGMQVDLNADSSLRNQITWTSSEPDIATVSNGVVTAIGPGETVIRARYGRQEKICLIRCVFSEPDNNIDTSISSGTGGVTEDGEVPGKDAAVTGGNIPSWSN